jgi:hyperosmotically inducible periplasmic protein
MMMKTGKSVSILLAALALFALSVPVLAASLDGRIESSARKSYVFQTYLKGDDIDIKSRQGVVTLTGLVSDSSHKALARDTVAGMPGVKSVDEKLEVRGTPPAENSDTWLLNKVKVTLLMHRSVSGTGTQVDVKDGVVTLRGTAHNQAQKELTTEYAKDVDGVKEVRNEMTVLEHPKKSRSAGEKIDDASITSLVKMTLLYHRSTSALHTKVSTKRGVVTLSGTANSLEQFNLAGKLALDVNGVKDVKNNLSVQ